MGIRAKLSLFNFISWLLFFVLTCFFFFLSSDSNESLLSNYRVTTSLLFLWANIINIMFLVIKIRKERTDEWNKKIESISGSVTMIFVAVFVYLASIILYISFESEGFVPVKWLWLLGYGSFYVVMMVFNLSYFLVSLKGVGYDS